MEIYKRYITNGTLLDLDYSIDANIPNADCSENEIVCEVFWAPREKKLIGRSISCTIILRTSFR